MSDNPIATGPIDVTAVPHDELVALDDSVLGHAVRRILALGQFAGRYSEPDPIAAHDSHV